METELLEQLPATGVKTMNIPADLHVHTAFSIDAQDGMKAMCEAALKKGLRYICFTDHLDHNPYDHGYDYFDYDGYAKAIEAVRREFGDRIQILKGVEFGEPHLYPQEFEAILQKDFDMIIAGVHFIDDLFIGEEKLLEKYSGQQIYELYYEQVLRMVEFGGFDVLAHLDFPKKYLPSSGHDLAIAAEILSQLAKSGIALEINTSPFRKGLQECAPGTRLYQTYLQYGGSKITCGSDAHCAAHVAADFKQALAMLECCPGGTPGFFQRRNFIALPNDCGR